MPEPDVDRTATGRPVEHFKLLAYAIGGLCLAVAALLVPTPIHSRGIAAAGDLVHAPLFGGLTLGVLAVSNRLWPLQRVTIAMARRCLIVAVLVFVFGVLIEVAQSILGRQGNMPDAINNGLGITSATLLYWGWQLQRSRLPSPNVARAFFMTAGIVVAIGWWNPIMVMLDARSVYSDFPSLATFESTVQFSRFYSRECELSLSRINVTQGKRSMEVSYEATDNPATTLVELQHDWSSLSTLEVDATLDVDFTGENVEFMIQVIDEPRQDEHTETFRGQWTLEPGKTKHIRITREEILNGPDSSKIDLSKIKYVDLMLIRPAAPANVRFDDLRLTLNPS
jgi:hypothetical protein